MPIRSLAEVGARLEEAVGLLPGSPGSSQDLYTRYEEMAISILDAEFSEHSPGVLEAYLMAYLRLKELELGVCLPGDDSITNTAPG